MTGRSDGRLTRDPATAPLPYVRGKTKTRIFWGVSAFHAGLIVIPLLLMTISRLLDPPLLVMRVPIVDSLPNDNPNLSPHPSPDRPDSKGTPDYGDPKPLTAIPDVPSLPKPEPKVTEPVPEPEKVKPVEKTEPVVKETPPEKVTEKSPKIKKTTPKPKYKTANEIKISKKIVRMPAQSGRQASRENDAARREISNMVRSLTGTPGGRGLPGGGGGPKGVVSKEINDYYNTVEVFLKRRWDQPNAEMLNRAKPKVVVRFKVDSSGRLLSAVVISKSGIEVMDASVQSLLSSLKVLPPPPMAMEFLVTLEIDR